MYGGSLIMRYANGVSDGSIRMSSSLFSFFFARFCDFAIWNEMK